MPKAAATPAARTPEPYSRPIAIIVAPAALEEEVDAPLVEAAPAPVDVGAALELDEVVATEVKLAGSR